MQADPSQLHPGTGATTWPPAVESPTHVVCHWQPGRAPHAAASVEVAQAVANAAQLEPFHRQPLAVVQLPCAWPLHHALLTHRARHRQPLAPAHAPDDAKPAHAASSLTQLEPFHEQLAATHTAASEHAVAPPAPTAEQTAAVGASEAGKVAKPKRISAENEAVTVAMAVLAWASLLLSRMLPDLSRTMSMFGGTLWVVNTVLPQAAAGSHSNRALQTSPVGQSLSLAQVLSTVQPPVTLQYWPEGQVGPMQVSLGAQA